MVEAIFILLNFYFIYWLIDEGFRKLFLDSYRNELFELRNSLLFHVAVNKADLSSPAYAQIREIINLNIRFAHNFNIIYFWYLKRRIKKFNLKISDIESSVKKILNEEKNEDLRNYYFGMLDKLNYFNIKYLILTSPWLWFKFGFLMLKSFIGHFALSYKEFNTAAKEAVITYQNEHPKISNIAIADARIEKRLVTA